MHRSRGQALVFLVAVVASLAAAFLLTFDTGQVVAQQQRLVNAADAAAYGGAAWQARLLNFEAYANRAIVANEVAIAQAVSLRSWSDYIGRAVANIDSVARYVPYLGQATTALRRGWSGADAALQPSLRALEATASAVNVALSNAQSVAHAAGIVGAQEIARRTLAAADATIAPSSAAPALFAANALAWGRFTTAYGGWARTRLRAVVLSGRDGFTRTRNTRLSTGPAALLARLEKRGGTDLIGFDSWRGMDTLALHMRRRVLFGRFRERVPIGWGAAENARLASPARGDHGGTWQTNPGTSGLAAARIAGASPQRARAYAGLPTTRDLADLQHRDNPVLEFAVDAARGASDVPSAAATLGVDALPAPGGRRVSLVARPPRDRYYALGMAQVQFDRPVGRADARREHPSLYSPYWVARLAPVTLRTRALVAAARGVPDPFGAAP